MTSSRKNVVPFERPAAYWAVRARRHYTPAQLPDAARLMRKALEKSGETTLALELSQIYGGMECYTAAERCLIRASARLGLTGSVCYAIGCCALSRGQEELAERALDQSLRLEPDGVFADQAQDMLDLYPWKQERWWPSSARGEWMLRRSRERMADGNAQEALRLAKAAWKKARTPDIALWLGELLPPEKGIRYLTFAARGLPGEWRPRLLLARACAALGRREEARRLLALARMLCVAMDQAEAFCQTAWDMGEGEQALALVNERLDRSPASVDYLRLKYLCLRHLGQDAKAQRTLATVLDIDPDDAEALHYRRHPEDQGLFRGRLDLLSALGSLVYAMPDRLRRGPLNRLLHLMVMYLKDQVDQERIYRLVPPLWRKLTRAEKRACDERRHYPLAFAAWLLLCSGRADAARQIVDQSPGRKRLLRLLRRFDRWTNEEA